MRRAAHFAALAIVLACAHAPSARDASELTLTAAAHAWTAWVDVETERAAALPEPAQTVRLDEIAELNQRWDALEAAFDAAWDAYDAAAAARTGDAGAALARARSARDRAMAFLATMGVRP